jgi:hypothetical protein
VAGEVAEDGDTLRVLWMDESVLTFTDPTVAGRVQWQGGCTYR